MGKLKVTIEKGPDLFGAWADNVPGIYGEGETVQGEISVEWTFDVQSFLQYYNGIFTKAALERITGVNQKLLGHYASGLKKPRKAQVEKIESALHGFLNDISQVHLA